MNLLESIVAERRADVAEARRRVPVERLKEEAAGRIHHSLTHMLRTRAGTCIIAEMKQASPSAGLLRADYRPAATAGLYERHGACAVSVLTEPRHFMGSESHLRDARRAVGIPILRKDFVCDVYHVAEAAAWGADVVLLILAALDDSLAEALYEQALALGLDVLVETHKEDEIQRALRFKQAVVGVNSRDLKTLKTDLAVARRLASLIPPERLSIAESGITSREEVVSLEGMGYNGFLIGEALMAASDPASKLEELLGKTARIDAERETRS